MRPQPEEKQKKLHIGKGVRLQTYAWCSIVGVVLLIGITFAWYGMQKKEAETETATVMKPYYLTLLNPSETDTLQLSIGSLQKGQTKQIVFCVSSKEAEQINTDTVAFEYELELVHTDNLPLNYVIYPLEEATESTEGALLVEDIVTENGNETAVTTYWKKVTVTVDGSDQALPLKGTDVSKIRWQQAGLPESGAVQVEGTVSANDIINRGTYIAYGNIVNGEDAGEASDDSSNSDSAEYNEDYELKLVPENGESYDSQFFVLEISWKDIEKYSIYDKETDLIYLLAKALQPKPEEVETSTP